MNHVNHDPSVEACCVLARAARGGRDAGERAEKRTIFVERVRSLREIRDTDVTVFFSSGNV